MKTNFSKALSGHCKSAHNGEVDKDCPACKELIQKVLTPKNKEHGPSKQPSGCGNVFQRGKNPTRKCNTGVHYRCGGRHGRKHGMEGEKCTCECHRNTQDVVDDTKIISDMLKRTTYRRTRTIY